MRIISAGADVLAKVLVVAALVIMGVLAVDDDSEDDDAGDDHGSGGGSRATARHRYRGPPRRWVIIARICPVRRLAASRCPNGTSRRPRLPQRVAAIAKPGHAERVLAARALHRRDLGAGDRRRVVALLLAVRGEAALPVFVARSILNGAAVLFLFQPLLLGSRSLRSR